jgi:undecaprenyl-diphosphatase
VVGAIGLGLAVAFVWLGLIVRSGPTTLDTAVAAVVVAIATGWIRSVLDSFSLLGKPIIWDVAVLAIAIVLGFRGHRRGALGLVSWLLVAECAAEVAKVLFDRVRPGNVAVSDIITQASYPSGHVTRTVVTLGLLVLIGTAPVRARAVAIGLAAVLSLLMGAARVAAGEHWPTDVIGGFLLAGVVLSVAALEALRHERRSGVLPPSADQS